MFFRILYSIILFTLLFIFPFWIFAVLSLLGIFIYNFYFESGILLLIYLSIFTPNFLSHKLYIYILIWFVIFFVFEKVKPLIIKK
jgi:hypothetical protein